MPIKIKLAVLTAIVLWASAFVAIRASLVDYSPEGLALLRYLIASSLISIFYFRLPNKNKIARKDIYGLLTVGAFGIGAYNIALNYGELTISSGMASFIISQAPIISAIIAVTFLGERLNLISMLGFMTSMLGVFFIAIGEFGKFQINESFYYILLATIAGGAYSVLQKPFLKKYHAIEATTYVIWGGTLFLLLYLPKLQHDILHASLSTTLAIVYLGIFPATLGYVAWSYVLAVIPASQAMSFMYFTPLIATLMGWIFLGEVPMMLSILGGLLAVLGVWLVNFSFKNKNIINAEVNR